MNLNRTALTCIVNGVDLTSEFQKDTEYNRNDLEDMTLERVDTEQKLKIGLPIDIILTFTVKNRLLDMEFEIGDDYRGKNLEGLLGNFNNNSYDDLQLPNGTILSTVNRNYTEREIYFQFGNLWEISVAANESMFTYADGKTQADYRHPDFVPFFADEATPEKRKEAENVCGGADKKPCIYDYLATGDSVLAQTTEGTSQTAEDTRKLEGNQLPTITGPRTERFEVNKTTTLTYQLDDDGTPNATVNTSLVESDGFTYTVNGNSVILKWTPKDDKPEDIVVNVFDDLNQYGSPMTLNILMCSGCNGNGECSQNTTRTKEVSKFKLLTCICKVGYIGDDCENEENGCDSTPCLPQQNCTDLSPAEQVTFSRSYNCSACPKGYNTAEQECVDIDECLNDTTNTCKQKCENNIGSYTCSCNPGYRMINNVCTDIDECIERTSGCEQECKNIDGNFTCSCVLGYELSGDGKTCVFKSDVCTANQLNCEYACSNSSEAFECICKNGYELAANKQNCSDIKECERNICSQKCANSDGSFTCSCYDGYSLTSDKLTCDECDDEKWGPNCQNECSDCNDIGTTSCHHVKGCVCKAGFTGDKCETDIDECTVTPDICGSSKTCANTDGTYTCNCLTGFQEDVSGNCVDINECDDTTLFNCSDYASCSNVAGSYTCNCKTGFKAAANGYDCEDNDECSLGTADCQQGCTNNQGSFMCTCKLGFSLNDDRKTCVKVSDPCSTVDNLALNCSYACTIAEDKPVCICQEGFLIGNDKETCVDVNECNDNSKNGCTYKDRCTNTDGGYTCSCPSGQKLTNDLRSCIDCDDFHYGDNCANKCDCGQGASTCHKIRGCVCKNGWTGDKCDKDINECLQSPNPCSGANQECINGNGDFSCRCKTGYTNESNVCIDINECTVGTSGCAQDCTNNGGSYVCSCRPGFRLSGEKDCIDIDECKTGKSKCDQECLNTPGSYICSCNNGYVLNATTLQTCYAKTVCDKGDTCEQRCTVIGGNDTCSCENGYTLTAGVNCTNIDECKNNPCSQTCTDNTPGYTCSCNDGYKLETDQVTCKVCSEGTYGPNCGLNCTCVTENTESCNKDNGTCTCKSGWSGLECQSNINECDRNATCHANAKCKDTNGSYVCECNDGYIAVSTTQCAACEKNKYGKNCASACTCNVDNTVSCNNVNGSCSCKEGWNGTDCSVDINECDNNPCLANSKCNNNNGSYTCTCLDGYEKQADAKCKNINECLVKINACGSNTDCADTDGSYNCTCKRGYIGDPNTSCKECDPFKYGSDCAFTCACNATNAHGCNNVDGTCNCTKYWNGTDCSVDVNECAEKLHDCPVANSECSNTEDGYDCICKPGYSGTGRDCKECTVSKFGVQCGQDCICVMANTESCNNVNGSCTCKAGWSSDNCSVDINECTSGTHNCTNLQTCNNTEGSFTCVCTHGTTSAGECIAAPTTYAPASNEKISRFKTKFNLTLSAGIDLTNKGSDGYIEAKNKTTNMLTNAMSSSVNDFKKIVVNNLEDGSLIVDFTVVTVDSNEATTSLTAFMVDIAKGKVLIYDGNVTTSAEQVQVIDENGNLVNITGTDDPCNLLQKFFQCKSGYVCRIRNGKAACLYDETDDEFALILGLGVGIPLFVVAVMVAVIICVYVKRVKFSRDSVSLDRSRDIGGYFSTGVAPKFSSWSRPAYYSPHGWYDADASESSSTDDDRRRKKNGKSKRIYDNTDVKTDDEYTYNDGAHTNFSWDFMYNYFGHQEEYKIKRPSTKLQPDPRF